MMPQLTHDILARPKAASITGPITTIFPHPNFREVLRGGIGGDMF